MATPTPAQLSRIYERTFPGIHHASQKLLPSLSIACADRGFNRDDLELVLAKSKRFIHSDSELRDFTSKLAGDINLAHVIRWAPAGALPEKYSEFSSPDSRAELVCKTALHELDIPESEWGTLRQRSAWLGAHRELARMIASPGYIRQPDVKELLDSSYHDSHYEFYDRQVENARTRFDLNQLGVATSTWIRAPFERAYNAHFQQIKRLKSEADASAHAEFYRLVDGLLNTRATHLDSQKVNAVFNRAGISLDKSTLQTHIKEACEYFKNPADTAEIPEKYLLPQKSMNEILKEFIVFLQRRGERISSRRESASSGFQHNLDQLVALQRVLAPRDLAVSMRPEPSGRSELAKYIIKKESKNPVTFLTGGNDSGVCDATTERENYRRPYLAVKYNYQEAALFKVPRSKKSGFPRRFGQIRMYAATTKDEEGREVPTLLVNSIDLEAEERKNLYLYRTAIDYAKDLAKQCGFKRLYLGKHADMAVGPFEKHHLFSDLKPVEQEISLVDHFETRKAFSDFFGGGDAYTQKHGRASLYEVPLA